MAIVNETPDILLFEPEIPANTGNVIRLCANCGFKLHLIEPMAFVLEDKRLRRAGLDYHEFAKLTTWPSLADYRTVNRERRLVCVETSASTRHSDFEFQATDALVFGSETRGLPDEVLEQPGTYCVRLPMLSHSRSLNLSNAVAVVAYETWRQLGYPQST